MMVQEGADKKAEPLGDGCCDLRVPRPWLRRVLHGARWRQGGVGKARQSCWQGPEIPWGDALSPGRPLAPQPSRRRLWGQQDEVRGPGPAAAGPGGEMGRASRAERHGMQVAASVHVAAVPAEGAPQGPHASCLPALPPCPRVGELGEGVFRACSTHRGPPRCQAPPPSLPSSSFSRAVFGSGGGPALHPLSLQHQ